MYSMIFTGATFVCGIALMCLVYAKRPPSVLWPSLFFVYLGATVWSAGEILIAFVVANPTDYWAAVVVLYMGIYIVLAAWLTFGLRYAALLDVALPKPFSALVPAAIVFYSLMAVATVTNPLHGQFIVARMGTANTFMPLWYVQAVMAYGILTFVIGLFVYLRYTKHHDTVSRQVTILLLATCFPMVANFLYISKTVDYGFDITVPAFGISALLFFWGIYRDRLFILSPVPLQQVIQHEHDGVFVLDGHGRILLFNRAAQHMLGQNDIFTQDRLTPILAPYLYPPGSPRSLSDEALNDLLHARTQPVNGHLFQVRHTDVRWVRLECTLLPHPRNRAAGLAVRLRDVTAIQSATEAVTHQSMVLEGILRSSDQGILVVDDAGDIVFVNRQFRELWSVPETEPLDSLSESFVRHMVAQISEPNALYVPSAKISQDPRFVGQDELHLSSGRILQRVTRPLEREGELSGRIWAYTDITELLRTSEALSVTDMQLAQSTQMLRLVLDTIPVRVFWKDLELTYLGCNRVFALDQEQSSPDQIVGLNDGDMIWSESAKVHRSQDRSIIASGKP
jgi:PAS domain S-box-containing protein